MLDEPVTEPVKRLIGKYESRIERLEKANGRLCEQINSMPEIVRCRDCAYSFDTGSRCRRWRTQDCFENSIPEHVIPDGFCSWAKRKEVGK